MIFRSLLTQRLRPRSFNDARMTPSIVISSLSPQQHHRGVGLEPMNTMNTPCRHMSSDANLKRDWILNPDVSSHIRASVALVTSDEKELDTGFEVCFLGTGAGHLSAFRGNSATALRMGSTTYMFDAGEGLQRQLMISAINAGDVRKIFITHLHGDHVLGLPGLLLALQLIAKTSSQAKKKNLQIYGPIGLYNFIASSLSLSCTELTYLTVEVFELTGGSNRWQHPGALRSFPEFRHRGLQRNSIPMNPDGTWTLEEADEVTTREEAVLHNSRARGMYIHAAEVHHVPKLQCFGYTVREPQQTRSLDPERARDLGVRPGEKYKLLKCGFSVQSDDGLLEVRAEDVLVGEPIKPRKFVLIGDCFGIPQPMVELCRDADVLVHEATLAEGESEDKIQRFGHSTPGMAGGFAGHVNAKVLALNHIGQSGGGNYTPSMNALVRSAEDATRASTRVQLSYDLMEIVVPRGGFDFEDKTATKRDGQEDVQVVPLVDGSTQEKAAENLA